VCCLVLLVLCSTLATYLPLRCHPPCQPLHWQVIGISAKERCTLLPTVGGEPQPTAAAAPPARAAALHLLPGLQPLHYQLEALLHRAGARQQRPAWAEFEDAWAEGLRE